MATSSPLLSVIILRIVLQSILINIINVNAMTDWIGAEEAHWLRRVLFADPTFKDEEWKFLHEIKSEAKRTSPEFEVLLQQRSDLAPKQYSYAEELAGSKQ